MVIFPCQHVADNINRSVCAPMPSRFDDLTNDAEIKILLPDAMKHALQVRALTERRSMSEIVRDLIATYLETAE